MSNTTKSENTTIQSTPDPVYILRDSLVADYQPKGEREMMLVTQMAQSWVRLARAHDAENRLFANSDPLSVIENNTAIFTKVQRYIADCERSWRKAMEELRRVQRARLGPHAFRDLGMQRPRTTYSPPNAQETIEAQQQAAARTATHQPPTANHQPPPSKHESLATGHGYEPLTTDH